MMKKAFTALAFLIIASLALTSCYKKPGPGTAEVKVVDNKGVAQKNVHVKMFCTQSGCAVHREGTTNTLGVYSQEFDLPVVLRVRAVRYDSTITVVGLPPNQQEKVEVDSLCGEGFIQVENDEVASETITILDCN